MIMKSMFRCRLNNGALLCTPAGKRPLVVAVTDGPKVMQQDPVTTSGTTFCSVLVRIPLAAMRVGGSLDNPSVHGSIYP